MLPLTVNCAYSATRSAPRPYLPRHASRLGAQLLLLLLLLLLLPRLSVTEGNFLEVDLPQSAADAPYEIIPCTFKPNVFTNFTLTVYGTEAAFDLRPK
jgi:hypothetical protein